MSEMTAVEILKGTRKLLSSEDRWTKDWYAVDAYGIDVFFDSQEACKWCLVGAVMHVAAYNRQSTKAMDMLRRNAGMTVDMFNDNEETTHQDVLDLLDKTIAENEVQNDIS